MTEQELLSRMDDHDCLGTTRQLDTIIDPDGQVKEQHPIDETIQTFDCYRGTHHEEVNG